MRYTAIGAATAIIEVGALRLLVDPAFDPPGGRYRAAPLPGFGCTKVTGPAIAADAIGRIDAVLLSHDEHFDNLDPAGRALLPTIPITLTTPQAARRLGGNARGLRPWETTTLIGSDGREVRISAHPGTPRPARRGPDRRARDRLLPGLGRAGPRRTLPLGRYGAVRGRPAGRREADGVGGGAQPGRSPVQGLRPSALHDGCSGGRAGGRPPQSTHRHPEPFPRLTHLRQSAAEARPIFEAAGVPARWILPGQSEEIEV